MTDTPDAEALFPSLAADIQDLIGLTKLRNIALDCGTGTLTASCLDTTGTERPITLEAHPDDRAMLAAAAGNQRVMLELRMASGEGNVRLALFAAQGDAAWEHGAMIDLSTPNFALEKLATRSRLAELGKQCAAVAHEIRQPLFTIAMAGENLRLAIASQPDLPPRAAAALDHIQEEVERARTIVDQTLSYAAGRGHKNHASAEDAAPHGDFTSAVAHAVRLLGYQLEKTDIDLELAMPDDSLPVAMPQIELEQILLNILRNSIESIESRKTSGWREKGAIRLELHSAQGQLLCTISDNGAGLDSAEPQTDFQPFVTTKGEDGNGLGLYICEQLLAKSGGRVSLLPGDGEGAKVEIVVPLLTESDGATKNQMSSRVNRIAN